MTVSALVDVFILFNALGDTSNDIGIVCNKCGETGHVASKCYSNKRKYGDYDKSWNNSRH